VVDNSNRNDNLLPGPGDRFPQPGQKGYDDGFQIVDSGRTLTPKENQWQKGNEKADYDASVKRVTSWDADNFQGAYDAAAKKGTGVVFIVGSQNTRDTQETLKNMEALKAKNPGAEIVYLDKDKIATDPRYQGLRDWVQKNTNNDNLSFMAQYGVRPGKDGKPEGGNLISTHWGSDTSSVAQQMQFAKMSTERHAGQFKIPEAQPDAKPDAKPDAAVNPAAVETPKRPLDVEKQYKELQDKMKLAREAKTAEEARKHFASRPSPDGKDPGGAIAQADAIDQSAVGKERTQVATAIEGAAKELEAAKTGPKELQESARQKLQALQERQKQLQALHDAPAQTRKEFAQRLLAEGKTLSAEGKDKDSTARGQALSAEGHALINEAATRVPGYFNSDERRQELGAMGYGEQGIKNINKIGAYGPDLPAPYQIGPNLFALTDSQREDMYKRSKEAEESAFAPGQDVKDKQRAIVEAAIKEAKAKNLPLVIKFGMRDCHGCEVMDRETVQPLAKALDGKAVVAAVDGFGAIDVLKEHGFVSPADQKSYPNVQVFDVSKAGNLSMAQNIDYESIQNKEAAIASVTQSVQAFHAARAEREKQAAAERAVREKAAEDAKQRQPGLPLPNLKLYQFTGDGRYASV
jgi:hypothetical protein